MRQRGDNYKQLGIEITSNEYGKSNRVLLPRLGYRETLASLLLTFETLILLTLREASCQVVRYPVDRPTAQRTNIYGQQLVRT